MKQKTILYKTPNLLNGTWRLDGGYRCGDPRKKPKFLDGSWMFSRNVYFGYMPAYNPLSFCNPKLPLLSLRVRGLWMKRYIFQMSNGTQQCRVASAYDMSVKSWMPPTWPGFRSAVAAWQGLGQATKARLDSRATKLGLRMSGFNYFIRLFIKNLPALSDYYPEN